jgi:ubiquinone/menaquinone biosynthesis C-methylase UbiE
MKLQIDPRSIFSNKADDYAAARPDYPSALFDQLKAICPPAEDMTVADVGAGTGLLTHGLLKSGYPVIAVEPNPEMRHAADERLGKLKGYHSIGGSAEATTIATGSVDLITVAQAFHWFDVERTRSEFLRILKPRGNVALISNERVKTDPLQMALEEIFKERRHITRTTSNLQNADQFFGTGKTERFSWPHTHSLDEDGLASLVFSRSHIPARDSKEGEVVESSVRKAFSRFAKNGRAKIHYQTTAIIGRPVEP